MPHSSFVEEGIYSWIRLRTHRFSQMPWLIQSIDTSEKGEAITHSSIPSEKTIWKWQWKRLMSRACAYPEEQQTRFLSVKCGLENRAGHRGQKDIFLSTMDF